MPHQERISIIMATPRKQASATQRKQVATRSCFRCDRTNHVKRDCRANYHANGKPICRTCNIVGHRTFDCTRGHHERHDGPRHDNGRHTTLRRQVSVTTRDRQTEYLVSTSGPLTYQWTFCYNTH